MPPKGSKKKEVKKEDTPTPPVTPMKEETRKDTPRSTPNKKKPPPVFNTLKTNPSLTLPVDVTYEGANPGAKAEKAGGYSHTVKLNAPDSFYLSGTMVFTEGEHEGKQAIFIVPARPFPFLKLPDVVRRRFYQIYFAPQGVINGDIVIDGKSRPCSKSYADGDANRVALLAVNKEIYTEASPVLYQHQIKVDSTSGLLDFLSQLSHHNRLLLRDIYIKNYIKTTSRSAVTLLSEAPHLKLLHIETGVSAESDPKKAAKAFYSDTWKFLESVGAVKTVRGTGDKASGVDILSFGKAALHFKDEKKVSRPWTDDMVEEFKELLRSKMKS